MSFLITCFVIFNNYQQKCNPILRLNIRILKIAKTIITMNKLNSETKSSYIKLQVSNCLNGKLLLVEIYRKDCSSCCRCLSF